MKQKYIINTVYSVCRSNIAIDDVNAGNILLTVALSFHVLLD